MVVSTYLMPRFEEFQDGSPPILSLGGEADTKPVKILLLFYGLNPFSSAQTIAELGDEG